MKETRNGSYREPYSSQIQQFENENLQNTKVSSIRIIASQFVAVFPLIFIKLRYGMGIGFTIVLLPELSKKNAEIDVTLDELTWFSSYCFVIPVAAISGGFVAQYAGVRRLLMFSYLLHISADLLFHWADSSAMILFAQVIVGFTAGITKGSCFAYMAEILHPKYRTMVMEAMNLVVLFGKFFSTLLGNFMYWRTQTLVSLIFPVIGFIFIHFIPDSPQWLASVYFKFTMSILLWLQTSIIPDKNRYVDAEKSLARLRGWTSPEAVKSELYSSIINASDQTSKITETTSDNDLYSKRGSKLKKTLSLYFHRSFYIPLLTVIAMSFFIEFNGISGLATFSGLIFEEINSPIDGHIAGSILAALSIVSAFIYIFSVCFLGKRILTLASISIITISCIIAVTFLYLTNSDLGASDIYSWIISVALVISYFGYHLGLGKLTYFLNSELFPQKLRYVGGGIGYFIDQIMSAIFDKSYLYIVQAITFPGTLIVFTIINIVAVFVTYFILPETEGITLRQIEERYTNKI